MKRSILPVFLAVLLTSFDGGDASEFAIDFDVLWEESSLIDQHCEFKNIDSAPL